MSKFIPSNFLSGYRHSFAVALSAIVFVLASSPWSAALAAGPVPTVTCGDYFHGTRPNGFGFDINFDKSVSVFFPEEGFSLEDPEDGFSVGDIEFSHPPGLITFSMMGVDLGPTPGYEFGVSTALVRDSIPRFPLTGDELAVTVRVPAGVTVGRQTGEANTASNTLHRSLYRRVSVGDASALEGTDSSIEFKVTLGYRDDCETVTVDWETAPGTATAGDDYTAASGTLTFGPGETTKTVSIAVLDDTQVENDETLTLGLSNASGATIADDEATGTVTDDDGNTLRVSIAAGSKSGTRSITPVSNSVTEGAAAVFTLTRTGSLADALTVDVSVTETGAMLKGSPAATVTFDANSAIAELSVETEDDEVAESASDITAALLTGGHYATDTNRASATVTVQDDDATPSITVTGQISVNENTTAVATLTATDDDTPVADLGWSIVGGADAAAFSLSEKGVLSFAAAKDFEAPDDADQDGDYEVTVRVTDGANPAVDATLTVQLTDVDEGAPRLSGARVDGDTLTLTFDKALDGSSVPASNSFSVTVEAVRRDFVSRTSRSDSVVSVSGSTVTLTLVSAVVAGERVFVSYLTPTGTNANPLKDADNNAVAAFYRQWVPNETSAHVNTPATGKPAISGAASVGTTLSASASGIADTDGLSNATFAWQWIANDGTSDTDIAGATGSTYTLTSAEAGKTIKVRVTFTDDGGTEEALVSEATAAVTVALPSVSVAAVSSPVTEGAAASFTLTRTGSLADALTVNVSVTENGAVLKGTPPATAIFNANSATAELRVETDDDEVAESASVITAELAAGIGYSMDAGASSATVTVEDDDAAPVVTTASPVEAAENGTTIATLAATDDDTPAADLAWSIVGGSDSAKFTLSAGGDLAFAAAKDFEAPDDADRNGNYEVTVRVTDGANPVDAAFTVRLADVDEIAPVLASTSGKTLWTSTLEWQDDYGNGWVNANAEDFSSPGWSEDGQACRIWYIAYGSASRELWLRVNSDFCADGISEPETLTLQVGGVTVGPGDALSALARGGIGIAIGVEADWTAGEQIQVRLTRTEADDTPASNAAPTGLPTISGTPQVSEPLTASIANIADADGLTNAIYVWQWIANDGTSDADIAGATSETYALTAAEAGKTMKARVTFTDDGGTEETLVSDPTAAVAAGQTREVSISAANDTTNTLTRSVTAQSNSVTEGTAAVFTLTRTGSLADTLTVNVGVTETGAMLNGAPPATVTFDADSATAELRVETDDDEVAESASVITAELAVGSGYSMNTGASSATVTVEDDDAAPVVTTASPVEAAENGTAIATLAATDDDTPAADLAWSIVGGSDSAKFTLSAGGNLAFAAAKDFEAPDDADRNGNYEVTVRVTDGANPVDAAFTVHLADVDEIAPVLSSANADGDALTLTFDEALDGNSVPAASAFSTTVDGVARGVSDVSMSGSSVTLTLASAVVSGETVTVGYTAPTGANARPLRGAAGNAVAGFSDEAVTNDTPASNAAPTGLPTISGIPQVGEPLTASIANIADVDGLTNAIYVWQWIANDGTSDADIAGATEATYTLTSAEVGKTVKVRATFTDDRGTEETVLSDATAAVEAAVPPAIVASGVQVTSAPQAASDTYGPGETITLTVTFDKAVTVDTTGGMPRIQFRLGPPRTDRWAEYSGGSGNTALTFTYEVQSGDMDSNGIWLPKNELHLRSGTIRDAATNTADAALSYGRAGLQSGHKVDGSLIDTPAIVAGGVQVTSTPQAASDTYGPGETIELTVTFDKAVTVDTTGGMPRIQFRLGPPRTDRWAEYSGGSGNTALTFTYEVQSGDMDSNGIWLPKNELHLRSGTIRDAATNTVDAALGYGRAGLQSGHKVDSSLIYTSEVSISAANDTTNTLTRSVTAQSNSVTEGTAAVFTLTRTGSLADTLTVNVGVTETGAMLNGAPPATVTFDADSATAELRVETDDDEVAESASVITAELAAGSGYSMNTGASSATVTVEDDDVAPVVTTASPVEAAENGTAIATLAATDDDTPAADLTWSIVGGSDSAKFTLSAGGDLAFVAAKDFEAPDDADRNGNYELTVRVTDGANPVDATLTVRLADVDEVAPALASASVDGDALMLTFGEALDEGSTPGSDAFAVAVGGTARGVSHVAVNGSAVTLTLASAVVSGETVTVGYTVPNTQPLQDVAGNPVAGFSDEAVTNDTPSSNAAPTGLPTISGTARVGETLTASASGIADADGLTNATFAWQWIANDGTSDTDIAGATAETYTLTAAVAGKTVKVRATFTDDGGTEETLVSDPTAAVAAGQTREVSISAANDTTNTLTRSVTAQSNSVTEGTAAVFTLTRTGSLADALMVNVGVTETGAMLNGAPPATVTFDADSSTAELSVETEDDEVVEPASVVTAALADGNGYSMDAGATSASVTVEDDDAAPVWPWGSTTLIFTVPENTTTVGELIALDDDTPDTALAWSIVGGADAAMFTISAGGNLAFASAKDFEAPDDADADGDYEFTVRVTDGANAVDYAIIVRLTDVVGGPDEPPVHTGPISVSVQCVDSAYRKDFDSIWWEMHFSAPVTVVRETGGARPYEIAGQDDTDFAWFAGGTPDAKGLVGPRHSSHRWNTTPRVPRPDGWHSAVVSDVNGVVITVPAGGWQDRSGNLNFNTASANSLYLAHNWKVSVADASAEGTDETIDFEATLNARDDCKTVTVDWTTADGTATAGEDYAAASGTLTFGPGETSKTIRVALLETVDVGGAEAFSVQLSNASGITLDDAEAIGTIFGEDVPASGQPTVTGAARVGEALTASASGITDENGLANATFAWQWIANDGASDADIAGATEAEYTLTSAEEGKTIKVRVTFTDDGGTEETLISEATAVVTAALPSVSVEAVSSPVTEGTAASFRLSRTGGTAAALTVAVSVTEEGAVVSGTAVSSVTFAAGSAEATLSVSTVNDSAAEADARVNVAVTAGSGYLVDSGARSAGVDVYDNDEVASAPVKTLWTSTLEWQGDYGAGWVNANADDFSSPGWSEDANECRIWYMAYGAASRELWLRVNADLCEDGISEPETLTLHVGGVTVGPGDGLSDFARRTVGIVTGVEADWAPGEQIQLRLTRTEAGQTVSSDPGISVADAQVREAEGAALAFRVTLDAAQSSAVSVRYATSDGTATAGADYESVSGALRFEVGETTKTVSVPVLNDAHDEGSETLTLALSRPFGAELADGAATGTIVNTGPMPQAWITRFGRTVGLQAIEAIGDRLSGAGGTEVVVGGVGLSGSGAYAGTALGEKTDWPMGPEDEAWSPDDDNGRGMTSRELLLGSSFQFGAGGEDGAPSLTAWGRVARSSFDGEEAGMSLSGDVTTGFLGADMAHDSWLAGLAVGVSEGEGSFDDGAGDGGGTVESSLTSVFPYTRFGLGDGVDMWGLVGVGSGDLKLTVGEEEFRTDLSMRMGALGLRGEVVPAEEAGDIELAVKADAMWVRTESDAARSSIGGNLEAASGDASRVRIALEGSRVFATGSGGMFTPTLELGLRHDAGDAETGTGVEVAAGLRYVDPGLGLTMEGNVRGLLTHSDDGYEEWGASGSVRLDPGVSGRGASLTIAPVWGAASGGVEQLWSTGATSGLTLDDEFKAEAGLQTELGYGLRPPVGHGVLTPYTGLSLGEADSRMYRIGVRWNVGPQAWISLDGNREETSAGSAPTDTMMLRAAVRF